MRFAPLALALVLVLVGCRDYIVDDDGGLVPPSPPQPSPELPTMFLKGPGEVRVGEMPTYKAEQFEDGTTYEFRINNSEPVLISQDGDLDRFFLAEVVGQGQVELRVTAYNADGEAFRFARRWIEAYY